MESGLPQLSIQQLQLLPLILIQQQPIPLQLLTLQLPLPLKQLQLLHHLLQSTKLLLLMLQLLLASTTLPLELLTVTSRRQLQHSQWRQQPILLAMILTLRQPKLLHCTIRFLILHQTQEEYHIHPKCQLLTREVS
jgi:hypothetical protein